MKINLRKIKKIIIQWSAEEFLQYIIIDQHSLQTCYFVNIFDFNFNSEVLYREMSWFFRHCPAPDSLILLCGFDKNNKRSKDLL